MEKLNNFISKFSKIFIIGLFIFIIIFSLFIRSMYNYEDYPSFEGINILSLIALIIILGLLLITTKLTKIKTTYIYLIYAVLGILYILIVPLKIFSDMKFVTNIALSNFTTGMDYLYRCPNNLFISVIFNMFFRIFMYDTLTIKVINIFCNILIAFFSYRIYCLIFSHTQQYVDDKLSILLVLSNLSAFLYINHLYNDIFFVLLSIIIIYLVLLNKKSNWHTILIGFLCFILFELRAVGIIIVIAISIYYILKEKYIKKTVCILSIFAFLALSYSIISNHFLPKNETTYPVWSYIQMGFNEEEFGFQDGSHRADYTFNDVIDKLNDLGFVRTFKLLCKKEAWLWTEGTYQVSRYAFGEDTQNAFEYTTFITGELEKVSSSNLRKGINYIIKAQYFALVFLSIIGLLHNKDNRKIDLLLYIIIGFFTFYLFWEIKSRYIYSLYPFFAIFATHGINVIRNKIADKK